MDWNLPIFVFSSLPPPSILSFLKGESVHSKDFNSILCPVAQKRKTAVVKTTAIKRYFMRSDLKHSKWVNSQFDIRSAVFWVWEHFSKEKGVCHWSCTVSTWICDFPFLIESRWLRPRWCGHKLCLYKDGFLLETRDVVQTQAPCWESGGPKRK